MRLKPTELKKLRILFFLFYLSSNSSLSSHAQDSEEKAAERSLPTPMETRKLTSYSVKKPSLVLFDQKTSNRLNVSAKEVEANSGDGSVFISPRVEFAIGNFVYVSESEKALTDYRPASDGSISLTGSVTLIRYTSDTRQLSIESDLLAIDLLNEKITGAGSVKLLIGDSIHTGANFSIEQSGVFRLRGENGSRIKGEVYLTSNREMEKKL